MVKTSFTLNTCLHGTVEGEFLHLAPAEPGRGWAPWPAAALCAARLAPCSLPSSPFKTFTYAWLCRKIPEQTKVLSTFSVLFPIKVREVNPQADSVKAWNKLKSPPAPPKQMDHEFYSPMQWELPAFSSKQKTWCKRDCSPQGRNIAVKSFLSPLLKKKKKSSDE